jgi:hypothetical protein
MEKDRLAAFSDGVIAIIITIMVLELKVPHDASLDALVAVTPVFLICCRAAGGAAEARLDHGGKPSSSRGPLTR